MMSNKRSIITEQGMKEARSMGQDNGEWLARAKSKGLRQTAAGCMRAGNSDKLCDRLADAIVDAHLSQDEDARLDVRASVSPGKVVLSGEAYSSARVDYEELVWDQISEIGYLSGDLCRPGQELEIENRIVCPETDKASPAGRIVTGYATAETPEGLPLPLILAYGLCRMLDRMQYRAPWLGVDGGVRVSLLQGADEPAFLTRIELEVQHTPDISPEELRQAVSERTAECARAVCQAQKDFGETAQAAGGHILYRGQWPTTGRRLTCALAPEMRTEGARLRINPAGAYLTGGPMAGTGRSGRRSAMDQYGPGIPGAGYLSGKSPERLERCGGYAARWLAKIIVDAGFARHCQTRMVFADGREAPDLTVNTFGTGALPDNLLAHMAARQFDLRPEAIRGAFRLNRPIYAPLATYGHFGRRELPWEQTDEAVKALRKMAY